MVHRIIVCPWCHADMNIGEQNGVEIDQCPNCGGVWLDRGELSTIIKRLSPSEPDDSPDQEAAVHGRLHGIAVDEFEWF